MSKQRDKAEVKARHRHGQAWAGTDELSEPHQFQPMLVIDTVKHGLELMRLGKLIRRKLRSVHAPDGV